MFELRPCFLWHSAGVSADPAVPPSGVVTFLEGSTRRWETNADEMRVALAAHDKVLRAAVEAHGTGNCNSRCAATAASTADLGEANAAHTPSPVCLNTQPCVFC